jgi:hypothetical protein
MPMPTELDHELNSIFDDTEPANADNQNNQDSIKTDDFFIDSSANNSSTLINSLLESRGIKDAQVTIIDENNNEEKVDFFTLTPTEQLEILDPILSEESDLDDSEIAFLNYLRTNNLTTDEFLANYRQSIIDELGTSQAQDYSIDSYDDQELFLLDLKNKFDLTDEELVKELEKELQDEDLFKKKVDVLRKEYKQLEDQYRLNQQAELERKEAENYEQFSDLMTNIALQTPEFYGIELEDEEKDEILSFLLDLDENGMSEFYKSLNDPKKLYEAAWFLRYGKQSFDVLKNAYESEIARIKKQDKPAVIRKSADDETEIKSIHNLI